MADHRTVTISGGKARRIASEWHGGGHTALYAFSSSGAIQEGILAEIGCGILDLRDRISRGEKRKNQLHELQQLRRYITLKGQRGPVVGWYHINFDK